MHAVLLTATLQFAETTVPAMLVQTELPEALTAAWTLRVALPELPDGHVRLTVCRGAEG